MAKDQSNGEMKCQRLVSSFTSFLEFWTPVTASQVRQFLFDILAATIYKKLSRSSSQH